MSFVEGDVANYPLPEWLWADAILSDAAHLLRRIHDASAPLIEHDLHWDGPASEPVEVICHNDFAPYNLVFRDRRLVGAIDFDAAAPGSRVWDLAYLVYRLAPIVEDAGAHPVDLVLERAHRAVDAYGYLFGLDELFETLAVRLERLASYTVGAAVRNDSAGLLCHADMYLRDRERVLGLAAQARLAAPKR